MRTRLVCLFIGCLGCAAGCTTDPGHRCGPGTLERKGVCLPLAVTCEPGTVVDPASGACLPDLEAICGPGTAVDDDGRCLPVTLLSCGPGTIETEDGRCLPLCGDGQVYDESASGCVDQCGAGTLFDPESGACEPRCNDDQYYVAGSDTCLPVPRCLRNTLLGESSGDCEGWPWYELSLETFCARRAFSLCDSMLGCGCADGGESVLRGGQRLDHAGCLAEHTFVCEQLWLAPYRELVEQGLLALVPQALNDFDAHFAIAPGVCTRPVGWEMWPADRVPGLFTGSVARDEECPADDVVSGSVVCSAADYCADDGGDGLSCQPRAAAGERCEQRPCTADRRCLKDLDESYRCLSLRLQDERCSAHADCVTGLYCYPADLSQYLDGQVSTLAEPTCRPPMVAGRSCPGEAWQRYRQTNGIPPHTYNLEEAHHLDLCGPNLICAGAHPENEFVGLCQAGGSAGDACDWCSERAYRWDYLTVESSVWSGALWMANAPADGWRRPASPTAFGSCGGGELTCVHDASLPVSRGRCAGEVSVCQFNTAEIYDSGGICTERCDDGIDNDNDGLDVNGDGNVDYAFIDCDDPDCVEQCP